MEAASHLGLVAKQDNAPVCFELLEVATSLCYSKLWAFQTTVDIKESKMLFLLFFHHISVSHKDKAA